MTDRVCKQCGAPESEHMLREGRVMCDYDRALPGPASSNRVWDSLIRADVDIDTGQAMCEYTGIALGIVPGWYLRRLRARVGMDAMASHTQTCDHPEHLHGCPGDCWTRPHNPCPSGCQKVWHAIPNRAAIPKAAMIEHALYGLGFEVRQMRDTPLDKLDVPAALKRIEDEVCRIAKGEVSDLDLIG